MREKPDFSAWSEKRIRAYKVALSKHAQMPLAVLRIKRIRLEVPVFNGTDGVLDLGAGRIAGTAAPGEKGNIGMPAIGTATFARSEMSKSAIPSS